MESTKNAVADGYTIVRRRLRARPSRRTCAEPELRPAEGFRVRLLFAVLPNVLVVTPSFPVKSTRELIDWRKSHPGQVYMASAGPGSQSHLAGR